MPAFSFRKIFPSLGHIGSLLIALPVLAAVVLAIYIAAASVTESLRFGAATRQILNLVATAHDYAARNNNPPPQPDADLLTAMTRFGLVTGATLTGTKASLANPWQGDVRVTEPQPSLMRVEDDVPAHACRRLARFFIRTASDTALTAIEARDRNGSIWRPFYDASQSRGPAQDAVDVACGNVPQTTLALEFRLGAK